jgi:hypothetical protein
MNAGGACTSRRSWFGVFWHKDVARLKPKVILIDIGAFKVT